MTPRTFALQMRWLALAGYSPITLDALIAQRCGQAAETLRPVIITFDDGYQDCLDYAVPILQARGFTATFFLVSGLVGQTSVWLHTEHGADLPLLDWTAARRLEAAGFRCGAHTVTHPRLADLPPARCREELRMSRLVLEDRLGQEIVHLAYPFGSFNERVRALAEQTGYHSACSVRIGLSTPDDDLLALHRVPVTGYDSLLDFICRLRGGYAFSESLRDKIQRLRRRRRTATI